MKYIIRHTHKGYAEKRNFLYLRNRQIIDNERISFKEEKDLFKLLSWIYFKIFNKINYTLNNLHFNPIAKNKKYHFFNAISLSSCDYVVSFETAIPRFINGPSFLEKLGVKKLASKNCKKIIALSNCTQNIQDNFLRKNYPMYHKTIIDKCIVLHPPQELYINAIKEKQINIDTIVFTIVGADFFRKGGLEVLKAFKRLDNTNYFNWHLNIVSSMQYGDYATKTNQENYSLALKMIDSNKKISHFKKLPNENVIRLFKESHVGLLPTYADTYGYSVLEAQACGCPVVTTNIRALPEINNEDCGWVINVPKDNLGNGELSTEEERNYFSNHISEQLYIILKEILNHPEEIFKKGEKSLERIKDIHDPVKHAETLSQIYNSKS